MAIKFETEAYERAAAQVNARAEKNAAEIEARTGKKWDLPTLANERGNSSTRDKNIAEAEKKESEKTAETKPKSNKLWESIKASARKAEADPYSGYATDELTAKNMNMPKKYDDGTVLAQLVRDRANGMKYGETPTAGAEPPPYGVEAEEADRAKRLGELQERYYTQEREYKNAVKSAERWKNGFAVNSEAQSAAEKRVKDAESELAFTRQEMQDIGGRAQSKPTAWERVKNTVTGGGKQSAAGYVNALGTLENSGAALGENSSEQMRTVADNPYSGWATDELTAQNMAAAPQSVETSGQLKSMREDAQKIFAVADKLAASSAEDLARAKEGAGPVGKFLVDVGAQGVQMMGDALLNAAAPGTGLWAMGARSFGSGAQEARAAGASEGQQFLYGFANAVVETLTEKISGLGDKFAYGMGLGDDAAEAIVAKLANSDTGRTVLRTLLAMGGEGAEEFLADASMQIAQGIYNGKTLKANWDDKDVVQWGYDALVGAVLGGLGNSVNILTGEDAKNNAALREREATVAAQDNGGTDTADGAELTKTVKKAPTGNVLYDAMQRADGAELVKAPKEPAGETLEKTSTDTTAPKTTAAEPVQSAQAAEAPTEAATAAQNTGDINTPPAEGKPKAQAPVEPQKRTEATEGDGAERERNFSKNIAGDTAMEDAIRKEYEEDPDFYKQKTNKATLAKAADIMRGGIDKAEQAVRDALAASKSGQKLSPEMVPLSRMVANELTRQGRVDAAREILSGIGAELTEAGQLSQAARILRNADPATKQETIFKLIDKLNKKLTAGQKQKNVKNGRGSGTGDIKVDSTLMTEFASAQTDEARDAVLDKITADIAKQIPSTFAEKFTALRYVNMLGNLKTQGRNIVGNTLMGTTAWAKRKVQAAAELTASLVTGGKYERNTALGVSQKLIKEAMADTENVKGELQGEAKYNDGSGDMSAAIRGKRTVFDFKPLEAYRKATVALMEGGDNIFLKRQYANSLAGWMKAHKVKSLADATPEQLERGRAFAIKEAQEATFHDSNKLSDWVSKLGRGEDTPKALRFMLEGIAPFRKTPANVAIRAVEYSPLGIALTISDAVNSNKSTADVINSAAKTVTGSSLALAGYLLAMAGKARTKDEDEDRGNYAKMTGALDYSVNVGGVDISLAQFSPVSVPFLMGVGIFEAVSSEESFNFEMAKKIGGAMTDTLIQQSMLQGVNEAMKTAASGDGEAVVNNFVNASLSYLMQGVQNSLLGQIGQAQYENRQTTYRNKDNPLSNATQDALSKAAMKSPVIGAFAPNLRQNQDYVDAWGRKQSQGGKGERYINALINPTYYSQTEATPLDKELNGLHEALKDTEGYTSVFPQKGSRSQTFGKDKQTMTPEEYEQYSIERGQKSYELVSDFMESEQYKGLSDQEKADVIRELYSLAADEAFDAVKEKHGVEKSKNYELEERLQDPVAYLTADVKIRSDYEAKGKAKPSQGRELFENYLYYGVKGKDADALAEKNLGKKNLGAYTVMRDNNKRPQDIMGMLDAWDIIKSDGKTQDKPDGNYNQAAVYKGLSGLNIPDSDKSKIWNALLGDPKTQYSDYRAK